jgi:hypothetical protein
MPRVRACRPVEHPGRNFKPPIGLRLFQRAAEDDKTTLVDGTMNANSATKPGMMPIKNLAKTRGIRPQLPGCSIV